MKNIYTFGCAILTSICLFLTPATAFAQPSNDDCSNAILLDNIQVFCSDPDAYTNSGATNDVDDLTLSTCTDDKDQDVWFKFIPLEPNITITVIGRTGGNAPGGTLRNPAIELLFAPGGDCKDELDYVDCGADEDGTGTATVNRGGLIPGTEYLIRIQSTRNRSGTFQLCINNYTPPFPPESDCSDANLLCDKSTFFIEKIEGAGDDPDEAAGSCLGECDIFSNSESSSTWYKWIAGTSGSLTFTLTPENPEDDLDFALYELPDGLDDCNDKELLRCMASGEVLGRPFSFWRRCTGPTGLRENDGDFEETCGCDNGDNNFADAIQMEEGKTYALLINNFSESDDGFTVSFGGTGEFLGPDPKADFTTNDGDLCAGAEVTFSGNNSSFQLGAITDYRWSFGLGATPASATGVGPHTVIYETPGEKNVLLTVETDLGCVASDRNEAIVVIEACCEDKNAITASGTVMDAICEGQKGAINVEATSPSTITGYEWSNNETTKDISNLDPDNYQVTITNLASCEEVLPFEVLAGAPFEVVQDITLPTCNGGQNGIIGLSITGDALPILVDFGNGFESSTTLDNLSEGTYDVIIQDANGCQDDLSIELNELELTIDSAVMSIQPPSCNGFRNGRIAIQITNGEPAYTYDWNDNNGPVSNSNLNNIPAGTYQLDVVDANNCEGTFEFIVAEPDALVLELDTTNVSCQGMEDGAITAIVEGGTGTYQYEWSNGAITEQVMNLTTGNYNVEITDDNDCIISGAATIIEPSPISIDVTETTDAICFGDETGSISVIGIGGNNNFQYSADGINFQNDPTLMGLGAGDYTLTVRDPRGCTATTTASIGEPDELIVDAGEDQSIDLGYSVDFQTIKTPFTKDVTYSWTMADFLDCPDCPNPTATPNNTMPFVVTITDDTNCTAVDTVMVFVNLNRPIYVPNVFSPNFDGLNDKFTIFGGPAAIRISTLRIFDRWGNMVFNGLDLPVSDNNFGWDGLFNGKELQPGVYSYVANVLFFDGIEETYGGDITLVK